MPRIKIGWAMRDVSTTAPINIPGQFHMRISKGILDPVTVTSLVVDDGNDIVIFLSCDMVVARAGLLDEIRAKTAAKDAAIPTEKILMGVTHAHTGPSHYRDSVTAETPKDGVEVASSDAYRAFLSDKASDAIVEAYRNRTEGGIGYGYGYAVVAHSRRVVYFDDISKRPGAIINTTHGVDGHAKMYGNTNDDMFSHYEAGSDHFVNIMFTFDANDELTGAIINVPCPSQNSENEYMLSADYWHNVRENIRKKYGDIFILAQCAAAGDLSPRVLHYKQAQDRRYRLKYNEIETKAVNKTEYMNRLDIAERIAQCFDEVYSWAKKEIFTELEVCHVVETVELSKRLISDEEYEYSVESLKELENTEYKHGGDPLETLKENSILTSGRDRARGIITRYKEQKTEPKLPMELHVVKIGNIAFASNRFELYMDFQHRIQARSPFEQTFIIQLAAQPGETGGTYLCTQRGFEGKGYSASMYCNLVSYEGGQELVEETVRVLKEIK